MHHLHPVYPLTFDADKRARFLVDRQKRLKGCKRISSRDSRMSQAMTTGLQEDYSSVALKVLSSIKALFETQTRRDAVVDREPGTLDKVVLVELMAAALGTGLEPASAWDDMIQAIIFGYSNEVLAQPDPIAALKRGRDRTAPGSGKKLFSVSDTTMERATPSMDRAQLDAALRANYAECSAALAAMGARSTELFVANDDTSMPCRSASPNGWLKAARVGGRAKWEQSLPYSTRLDTTNMLFASCMPLASWLDAKNAPGQMPWFQEIAACTTEMSETGGHVVAVGMDRMFFQAAAFAEAACGKLATGDGTGNDDRGPRLVTPWKHGPDKDKVKWEYLLDSTKAQVTEETLEVDGTKHPDVVGINNGVVETTPDGTTTVKVARVALVDEYGAGEKRTLDEVRAEAKDVEEEMQATERDLEKNEQAYVAHREAAGKKDAKKPSYGRGKKRQRFADDEDKTLYNACQDLHEKKKRLETRKESILASLVFFAISLFPGEDVVALMTTFIELARDYHARWLIENGFKVVKESFCRDIRSCKPTARQFVLVLGMMLHNWWRVARMKQVVAWLHAHGKPVVLWKDGRPWIREPIERGIPGLVPAVTFLSQVLTEGILSIIHETIIGEK
jgi:hypothetical protein